MPRRGGRELFKSGKQAARDLERLRAKYPHSFPRTDGLSPAEPTPAPEPMPRAQGPGVLCRLHGVHWQKCTACSKTR